MIGLQISASIDPSGGASATGSRAARNQTSHATSLSADASASRSAKIGGSGDKTEAGSARAADRGSPSSPTNPTRTAQSSHANRREDATDHADRDTDSHEDFATVLASSSPTEDNKAVPLPPSIADDQGDGAGSPSPESSNQFLTLLSGTLALTADASGTKAGVPSAAESTLPTPSSTAISTANPHGIPSLLASAMSVATTGNTAPDALPVAAPGTGATAALVTARAPLTAATQPSLSMAAVAPSPDSEPLASLATLAASGIAPAAGRDATRPGTDGAVAVDGPSTVTIPLTATASVPLRTPLSALPPTAPLALPANPDAGFDDGFGSRIAWMAEQRVGHAQIRLNPEHVGPIEVRVQLDGDRVSAQFSSVHAEVRQAIEASMPRLRDMLGQHGLQLGQADVGKGDSGRGGGQGPGQGGSHSDEAKDGFLPMPATLVGTRRLLDEYA